VCGEDGSRNGELQTNKAVPFVPGPPIGAAIDDKPGLFKREELFVTAQDNGGLFAGCLFVHAFLR